MYIFSFALLLIFGVMVLAFQNCGTSRDTYPRVTGTPIIPTAATPIIPTDGDHAIFELYGVDSSQIESVLWRTNLPSIGRNGGLPTNVGMAIDWDEFSPPSPGINTSDDYLGAAVKLKGQNCITYINSYMLLLRQQQKKGPDESGASESQPSQQQIVDDLNTSSIASLDSKDEPFRPLDIKIEASTTDEPHTFKDYFPVGTSVNFSATLVASSISGESTLTNHLWRLKKLFQNAEQLVDDDHPLDLSSNIEENFSHTFTTMGLYRVSVHAYGDGEEHSYGSTYKDILIGACTGEEEAIEMILSHDSFGTQTPSKILESPYFNYIRPATPDHKISLLKDWDETQTLSGAIGFASNDDLDSDTESNNEEPTILKSFKTSDFLPIYYKYDRTSSSKFIEVNMQNIPSTIRCFFDDQPVVTDEEYCTKIGCPEDDPDCNTCYSHKTYDFRDQPLSSCNGNVYDMTALDTDTTKCTDAIVLFGFALNSEDEPHPIPFYKHCPANSQYCYFGPDFRGYSRPTDHHCPSEDPTSTSTTTTTTSSTTSTTSTTSTSSTTTSSTSST